MAFKILGSVLPASRGRWLAGVAFAGLMGLSGSAGAISVGFDVTGDGTFDSSLSMLVNSTKTVGVYVSQTNTEVTNNGGLISAQVALSASNSTLLGSTSVALNGGTWNGPVGATNDYDLTDGGGLVIQAVADPASDAVTTNYVKLFDLTLTAGGTPGLVGLTLGHTGDPTSDFVGYKGGTLHSYTFTGGDLSFSGLNVNITPVPLPGAVWLFGSGLLGLIGFKLRKDSGG